MSPRLQFGDDDASFQAAGGHEGVDRLVEAFYDAMETREDAKTILAMHVEDMAIAREKLKVFLAGWLGGPKEYATRFRKIRIPRVHAHLAIDEPERDAWLACMQQAVDAQDAWADDFKAYFMRAIAVPADRVRHASQKHRQDD